jgi:uncharacterized protein
MSSTSVDAIFHEGEREVQRRAGVAEVAERVGEANIRDSVSVDFAAFLAGRFFVVVGSADPDGCVWASLLIGAPGFIRASDAHHLVVSAQPPSGDPLGRALDHGATAVGLLAIEPDARGRIRINGVARRESGGGLAIEVKEAFGNCPKYIQRRIAVELIGDGAVGVERSRAAELDDVARELVSSADTFFIADASHRGGRPGFVRVAPDGRSVSFPDYRGNSMFQTLGNLQADGRAGLLFLDWERGDTLQLSGRATIVWDADTIAAWPGAERVVRFNVEAVERGATALPLRWQLIEPHRLNPPLPE